MGNEVTHATFPLSSRVVDQGHPLKYMAPRTTDDAGSCQHVYLLGNEFKRVGEVHLPVQSGTELTDYHILGMWLVRSNA